MSSNSKFWTSVLLQYLFLKVVQNTWLNWIHPSLIVHAFQEKMCFDLSVNLSLLRELQNGPFLVVKKISVQVLRYRKRSGSDYIFATDNLFTAVSFIEGWLSEGPVQIKAQWKVLSMNNRRYPWLLSRTPCYSWPDICEPLLFSDVNNCLWIFSHCRQCSKNPITKRQTWNLMNKTVLPGANYQVIWSHCYQICFQKPQSVRYWSASVIQCFLLKCITRNDWKMLLENERLGFVVHVTIKWWHSNHSIKNSAKDN